MITGGPRPAHLGYCTNIHPGETWPEVRRNLESSVLRVKSLVSPQASFGVGLRLSGAAASDLADERNFDELRGFLSDHDLYVFTINGFPYGPFHGTPVKEQVYQPDWLEDERLRYSAVLAILLAKLVPEGQTGSVSTVPGCYRPRGEVSGAREDIARRLLRHAVHLVALERDAGRTITLALEPEPHCLFETTSEAIHFFETSLFSREPLSRFADECGLGMAAAEEALRRHLGLCFDACHAAVEFEDPAEAVARLGAAGIAIHKIQVSAGLRVCPVSPENREALRAFADDVYLHQVVARSGDQLRRYADLGPALADPASEGDEEWRIHFHVPLFREHLGRFTNTQGFLRTLLAKQAREGLTSHLEVETYTWHVLPAEFRGESVEEDVARELRWAMAALAP